MKGDSQAIGAELVLSTAQNTIYQSESRVSFDELYDWLAIYQEERIEQRKAVGVGVGVEGLLHFSAILKLLEGVSEGQRDNTFYTLALTFKASGYDEKETEIRLKELNQSNDPSMRELEIKRKVKSAYKNGALAGLIVYWIRLLSGMNFSY